MIGVREDGSGEEERGECREAERMRWGKRGA